MATRRVATPRPTTLFYQRLILADWLLNELGITQWDKARGLLREAEEAMPDASGVPDFLPVVRAFEKGRLGVGALDAIDDAIKTHWRSITDGRRTPNRPKCLYFQYLALCGSHLYLERLFLDRGALLASLNSALNQWNSLHGAGDQIAPYVDSDLNKLAFWSATGSGKTLLMHAQLLQYMALSQRAQQEGWQDAPVPLDRVFLITPSEGLSLQHREEAALSGIAAREFRVEKSLVEPTIETLTINRLGDEMGQKVVALSALKGVNLVLVDEGHRGASGEVWKKRRDTLSADGGFALEYSATFGQAVGSDNGPLAQEYTKCIAFDYSYRRFYFDGYGKEFDIFNLVSHNDDAHRDRYLTACALSFLIQRQAFDKWGQKAWKFGFQKPLWVFVGGTVNNPNAKKQDLSAEEKTDVLEIALFFSRLLSRRTEFEGHIKALLERRGELHAGTHDPFYHLFDALGTDAQATYEALIHHVFGGEGATGLVLEHLKGADGEISLRAGNTDAPFGLINVGDAAKFATLAREHGLTVEEKAVSSSLFEGISHSDSPLSVLIGARKFAEGWNSFRVSTLGLMKIGQGEGSQIIQMFGRGVRLRGFNNSLRRSGELAGVELPDGAKLGDIAPLETLRVFGLKANYMETFREALRQEGVPSGEKIVITIPTRPMTGLKALPPLHTLSRPSKKIWQDCAAPLILGNFSFNGNKVVVAKVKVDLYPKMQALVSSELHGENNGESTDSMTSKFGQEQLRFINWDTVMSRLREAKEDNGWTTLRLERPRIEGLWRSDSSGWYELKAPPSFWELPLDKPMARIALWQNTVTELLIELCKKFVAKARADFERDELKLVPLEPQKDSSWEDSWKLTLQASDPLLESEVSNLWAKFDGDGKFNFGVFHALNPAHHFYSPLLYLSKSGQLKLSPVALDEAEFQFACKLEVFAASGSSWFDHRQVFFLRNKAIDGIGFYDGGKGFYPDFALWIWETLPDQSPREYLAFFDPKGLVNFQPDSDKVTLHKRIKGEYQVPLGNQVTLNSFLVSTTDFQDIGWKGIDTKEQLRALGVFLPDTPVEELLNAALQ